MPEPNANGCTAWKGCTGIAVAPAGAAADVVACWLQPDGSVTIRSVPAGMATASAPVSSSRVMTSSFGTFSASVPFWPIPRIFASSRLSRNRTVMPAVSPAVDATLNTLRWPGIAAGFAAVELRVVGAPRMKPPELVTEPVSEPSALKVVGMVRPLSCRLEPGLASVAATFRTNGWSVNAPVGVKSSMRARRTTLRVTRANDVCLDGSRTTTVYSPSGRPAGTMAVSWCEELSVTPVSSRELLSSTLSPARKLSPEIVIVKVADGSATPVGVMPVTCIAAWIARTGGAGRMVVYPSAAQLWVLPGWVGVPATASQCGANPAG